MSLETKFGSKNTSSHSLVPTELMPIEAKIRFQNPQNTP